MPKFLPESEAFREKVIIAQINNSIHILKGISENSLVNAFARKPVAADLRKIHIYLENGNRPPWDTIQAGGFAGYLAFLHEISEIDCLEKKGFKAKPMEKMIADFGGQDSFNRNVHLRYGMRAEAIFLRKIIHVMTGECYSLTAIMLMNKIGVTRGTLKNNRRVIQRNLSRFRKPRIKILRRLVRALEAAERNFE